MSNATENTELASAPSLLDWAGVLAMAAIAVGALLSTAHLTVIGSFGPGPGLFPRVVGAALLLIAIGHTGLLLRGTIAARRQRPNVVADAGAGRLEASGSELSLAAAKVRPPLDRGATGRFIALSASMFCYALVLETVGFLVSTTALAGIALWLLGRSPVRALIEAAVGVFCLWLLFGSFLNVPLPQSDIAILNSIGL